MMNLKRMRREAKDLVRAILTRAKELDVSVGKTKLLKLLYLADIEHFRDSGKTLSGIPWIFYLYGPWSPEYDPLLQQLEGEGAIAREAFVAGALEGERLSIKDEVDLSKVIGSASEYFRTKHLVDTWLERGTSQLLDFVYFETEPMLSAVKGEALDFSKVSKEPPALYRRSKGTGTTQQKSELRAKLLESTKRMKEEIVRRRGFDARYSDNFAEALAILNTEGAE